MFGLRPPFGEDQAYRIDTGRLRDPAQFVLGPWVRGPQPEYRVRRFTQGLEPDGEDLRGKFVGLVEGTQHQGLLGQALDGAGRARRTGASAAVGLVAAREMDDAFGKLR